jgi:hypothetical protein
MALPSLLNRGYGKALWLGWVGEPFAFLSAHCFSSFHLNLFGIPTPLELRAHPPNPDQDLMFLINDNAGRKIKLSLHPLIGLMEEASLDWNESAKWFCTGVLGRAV